MSDRPVPIGHCRYVLLVGDRWMSTSKCHYGQTVAWPVPVRYEPQERAK